MPVYFLFLEFLGTTELLVIAFVALIIFGPRKLPELGRSVGRSLGEFKRASEDFKRTWEYEVEMERSGRETRVEQAPRSTLLEEEAAGEPAVADFAARSSDSLGAHEEQTVARTSPAATARGADDPESEGADVPAPTHKQDWL